VLKVDSCLGIEPGERVEDAGGDKVVPFKVLGHISRGCQCKANLPGAECVVAVEKQEQDEEDGCGKVCELEELVESIATWIRTSVKKSSKDASVKLTESTRWT
jgi:hypothetical protein